MQGLHVVQPGSRTIDLETFVSASHFLRRIDRVLDLSFIRELTAPRYANRGRPSIDPEVFFRIVLIGYFHGNASDR